ncbi:MAG: magnesium/cobalt transporter CorA [Candidatus Magasanikbacteria bacterium]|nr:magnesium/cobalt transporter CorA [Candidatus Magasanikbacteria bacterium]
MPTQAKQNKKRSQDNLISVMDYSETRLEEKKTHDLSECVRYKNTPEVTWINIENVPPLSFLSELGLGFDLHPVIMEDIIDPKQRPKIEILSDYIYLVLKMLTVPAGRQAPGKVGSQSFVSEQVSIVMADKFVLTFQQGVRGDAFDHARELIRKEKTRIRSLGTDYLVYELIDDIVNNYFRILEDFGEKIESLEAELVKNPSQQTLRSIYSLKREILSLRKAIWPLREVVDILERGDSPLIKKSTRIYLRDIYDRVVQAIDTMETYRDMTSGMLDIYLSSLSNRMNSVIKVLTIIATIFMPLTFLAGLYGMNFRYMPGLDSPSGFWAMTAVMLVVFWGMIIYFKKKGWL